MPARLAPFLFALILSATMSFLVSGISTWRALGMPDDFLAIWMVNWLFSWLVACPTAYFAGPIVRRAVNRITTDPA